MSLASHRFSSRFAFCYRLGLLLVLVCGVLALSGCAGMRIGDYKHTQPKLDLFDYFDGKTKAYGQFAGRSGAIKRKFTVDITGTVVGDTLTLDERFVYDDGEKQTRVWTIERSAGGRYVGTASDVVGKAVGAQVGAALNWRYTLDLPYKNSSIHVQFDDWMHLHQGGVLFNQAKVTKLGFKVGEVTLFFVKE